MTRVFIDGAHGTTGLEIAARLDQHPALVPLVLDDAARRDPAARRRALHEADFAVLCLPDDAAREAVELAEGSGVRIVDASSAHRVAPGWHYGLPELGADWRVAIADAARVANPGCYPTGMLALVTPLVAAGLIARDRALTVHATSGYSGGGKAMIAAFESGDAATAFRAYALSLAHKHVAEMQAHAGLTQPPLFAPAVANTYRGMIVEVPLTDAPPVGEVLGVLHEHYAGEALIDIAESDGDVPLAIEEHAGSDRMTLRVHGNDARRQLRLVATLDNLGKGAAGAAVQSLNIMAGLAETSGLRL